MECYHRDHWNFIFSFIFMFSLVLSRLYCHDVGKLVIRGFLQPVEKVSLYNPAYAQYLSILFYFILFLG